jgi:hypothetical protein
MIAPASANGNGPASTDSAHSSLEHWAWALALPGPLLTQAVEFNAPRLRQALVWALGHDPGGALGLAARLAPAWAARGQAREGARWLDAALSLLVPTPSLRRTLALLALGQLLQLLGSLAQSEQKLREALAWASEHDERALVSRLQSALSRVAHRASDYGAAKNWALAALASAQTLGDQPASQQTASDQAQQASLIALAERWLGRTLLYLDDLRAAEHYGQRALAWASANGDHEGASFAANTLGLLYAQQKVPDWPLAYQFLTQALLAARQSDDETLVALNLTGLGWVLGMMGEFGRAADLAGECLRLHQKHGSRWEVANDWLNLGHAKAGLGEMAAAQAAFKAALIEAVALAATSVLLEALVGWAGLQRDPEQAAQWLGAALGHPESNPELRAIAAPILARLGEQLEAEALAAALAAGQTLGLDSIASQLLAE